MIAEATATRPKRPADAPPRLTIRFLIANCYGVGGTIKATLDLAGELAKRHDVEIVSVQKSREKPRFRVPRGVRVRPLHDRSPAVLDRDEKARAPKDRFRVRVKSMLIARPSRLIHKDDYRYARFNLLTDLRLFRFLRSVDDGILIGTRAGLNLAVARFGRSTAIRVGQEHLNLTKYGSELRQAFIRSYGRLDAYTTLTEGDAEAYRGLLGPSARVLTIPNGIEIEGRPQSDTTSEIVIAAGRLTPQKGFDRLVEAWPLVARKHPDWQLRIFGTGSLRPKLQARIDELGIGESARLLGYTSKLPEEMAAAGFYVMSSRFEGFPMVLLEAMASGLPVVSYDCPTGPSNLITPGQDGFLVPNGDVEALALAMSEMIELREGRGAFGEAALAKASEYSLESIGRRWEALLLELSAERTDPLAGNDGR